MDPFRIGVIGLRFGRHHVTTLAQMEDVQLVALADRHFGAPGALDAYARRYGARVYDDGLAMIEREPMDAVSLCVSPRAREPLMRAAAARGLPMLVEKPWASDLAQAQRLAVLCREQNARVMIAFSFRFLPAIVKLRALLDGELGAPWMLNGQYVFRWQPRPDHWLWDPQNGGGFFNENSCHLFDAVCYLLGRPVALAAEASAFLGSPSEDAAAITVRYESGAMAALTVGGVGSAPDLDFPRLDLVTEHGLAHLTGRHHIWERLAWGLRDGDHLQDYATTPEVLGRTRYADAMRYFVDTVRAGAELTPGPEAGVMTVAMATAVYESVRTGRRVDLRW